MYKALEGSGHKSFRFKRTSMLFWKYLFPAKFDPISRILYRIEPESQREIATQLPFQSKRSCRSTIVWKYELSYLECIPILVLLQRVS